MATLSEATAANSATRIEEDLLGQRHVPADAYYGIHTLRAIENFNISNVTISDVPEFVRGMVMTKKAATLANNLADFRQLSAAIRRLYGRSLSHEKSGLKEINQEELRRPKARKCLPRAAEPW